MNKLILIDCGHCLRGADTGTGGYGLREEICTRDIGGRLKNKLEEKGYKVVLINCDEASSVSSSINYRVRQANMDIYLNAIMVISIHLNAGGGRGVEVYTKSGRSSIEAVNILKYLEEAGYKNPNGKSRGIKDGNHLGMVYSVKNEKAMLVECCFMDSEDMNIYDPEIIANAICSGITGISGDGEHNIPVKPPVISSEKKYLFLNSHVAKWNVYPTNVAPVIGNQCGVLAPSNYGGLEYEILLNPQVDVYTIETESFGRVNIYVPLDDDSKFYTKGEVVEQPNQEASKPSIDKYLNLNPHVSSWRVYSLGVPCVVGNECAKLSPSSYGGLSYKIIDNKGDIKIIQTEMFGTVQIYAPTDEDSSVTNNPIY